MRAYNVATVAIALRVSPKWIDNVLSHHSLPDVQQSRQGVPRRLGLDAITQLWLTLRLIEGLGVPVSRAIEVAEELIAKGGPRAACRLEGGGELTFDLNQAIATVTTSLAHAVEIAPAPRRGRPPAKRPSFS